MKIKKYLPLIFIILFLLIISILLFTLRTNTQIIEITEITPDINQPFNPLDEISIKFNTFDEFIVNSINIKIDNVDEFQTKWSDEKLIIRSNFFKTNSNYNIYILINNNLLNTLKISTIDLDEFTKDEYLTYQNQQIFINSEAYKDYIEANPWIGMLPISNDYYSITYDFDNDIIRVRLLNLIDKTAQEISDLKLEAAAKLESIGVSSNQRYVIIED